MYHLDNVEELIVRDDRFLFTFTSCVVVFIIYFNMNQLKSSVVGVVASMIYFLINGAFLGHAFFREEKNFLKSMLGIFTLVILIGLIGWAALIIYNLDEVRVTLVLLLAATGSSLLNWRAKHKNGVR